MNPRCFRYVKSKPIQYVSNSKAWMTSLIFEQWLLDLDRTFMKKNRTILLFIDNCSAHKKIPNLRNIKVIFFPPNMTSVIQPMDQGIIKNLKHFYRKQIVMNLLASINRNTNFKVDYLVASRFLKNAWQKVEPETISNCFGKAGFFPYVVPEINVVESDGSIDNCWPEISQKVAYNDYFNVDENLCTFGNMSEKEIVAEVLNKKICEGESSGEEEDAVTHKEIPTVSQASDCIEKLKLFVENQENVNESISFALQTLEEFTLNMEISQKKVQKKITNYLKNT